MSGAVLDLVDAGVTRIVMQPVRSEPSVLAASAKIVEDLFALGDEPNSPTHRIEFKDYRNRAQGGMCREALIGWLARAIERRVPKTASVTGAKRTVDAALADGCVCTMDSDCMPECCAQWRFAGKCANTGGDCKFRKPANAELRRSERAG